MVVDIVGQIGFGNFTLNVYGDLNEPLFRVKEIGEVLGYSEGNEYALIRLCEEDEKLTLPVLVGAQRRNVRMVTEGGLYNILEQSRMTVARKWRRVINNQLIQMRINEEKDITEQFGIWSEIANNIYFDEETGLIMESYTLPNGDVEQRPIK